MATHRNGGNVISRREALKTLAIITGVVSVANLPDAWSHPSIQVGVLPAHAQCSAGTLFKISDDFEPVTICQGYSQWVAEIGYNMPAPGDAIHFEVVFSGGTGGDAALLFIDGEGGAVTGKLDLTFCIDFGTHDQAILDLWGTDTLGCDTNHLNYTLSPSNIVAEPDNEPTIERVGGSTDW